MALQSILKDFAVRAGLIVEGTAAATSATGMTGTLQVNGGAAIARNLIVGETSDFKGDTFSRGNVTVEGAAFLSGVTATNRVVINTATQATTAGGGALAVTGGGYFGTNVVVNGNAESTTTLASNSLYVAGGAGINGSLVVRGEAVFQNDVIFSGETTYVYTTNTVYTDNIIELHYHEGTSSFTTNDGYDIGLRFHIFDGTNTNAFLGRDNATGYLEWLGSGVTEENTGTIESGTYGTFKTGAVILTNSTTSTSKVTGALQVAGGIGAENIYVNNARVSSLTQNRIVLVGANGQLVDDADLSFDPGTNTLNAVVSNANTATDIAGGASGSLLYQTGPGLTDFIPIGIAGQILLSDGSNPIWATTGTIVAGSASTASNLLFGTTYQIPYQTAPGQTAFEDNFKYNYDTNTLQTVNATFTGTTDASGPASGAVQITGGVSIGGSLYVGGTLYASVSGASSSATNVTSVATTVNATHYLTFVDSNNAVSGFEQLYTTSSVSFNPSNGNLTVAGVLSSNSLQTGAVTATGDLSAANISTTGTLSVSGTSTLGIVTLTELEINGDLTVKSSTASTSTNSGALQVWGGAGIGGDLYANRLISAKTVTAGRASPINSYPGLSALEAGSSSIYNSQNGDSAGFISNAYLASSGTYAGQFVSLGEPEASNHLLYAHNVSSGLHVWQVAGPAPKDEPITITTSSQMILSNSGLNVYGNVSVGFGTNFFGDPTPSTDPTSGALVVIGGAGISGDLNLGGDIAVNGGDLTTTAGTFNLVNANATAVNFAGASTATIISAATGYTAIRNQTTITSTVNATSAVTGALQVRGGVGIAGAVWIDQTLKVVNNSTLANVSAALTTVTNLTVNGQALVTNVLTVSESQNSNATTNGAVRIAGGVGVVKDVFVGGSITAGATLAATSATVVPAMFSNNFLLSSYTSGIISGITKVDLDSYSSTVYRSARYFVQILDGANIHISEISLFHDGVKAYINEYGIATNNGQLGVFDAELTLGNVIVNFTPTNATSMQIKMVRIGISA
jgi:hypothetical protein